MSPQTVAPEPVTAADLAADLALTQVTFLSTAFRAAAAPAECQPPAGITSYEELVRVSYQPQCGQLSAAVQLKLAHGYSGGICATGTPEYVTFFASTDGGATWTTLGITSFTASNFAGHKPLEVDVDLHVDLPRIYNEASEVLVRAILSWQVPPGSATAAVIWGNGIDTRVQVAPPASGRIRDLEACLDIAV
jgi:hypothetical protein